MISTQGMMSLGAKQEAGIAVIE
ncbi:BnaA03g57360D [Brassica napus]|uniref:BnaA03g57360D protein n=1 Tax=Brassica napus TaxID=3708 RepID=A0A078J3L9_BRANA|nr:BnaA03g57360D [Brassica napus]